MFGSSLSTQELFIAPASLLINENIDMGVFLIIMCLIMLLLKLSYLWPGRAYFKMPVGSLRHGPPSVSHMENFLITFLSAGEGCCLDTECLFIWTSWTSAQQREQKSSNQTNQIPWNLHKNLHFAPWPNPEIRISQRKPWGSYWSPQHSYPFLQEVNLRH